MLLGSQSPHLGGPGTSFLEEVRCWHPSTCLKADRTPWISSRVGGAATCSYGWLPHPNAKAVSVVGRDWMGCSTTTLEQPEASADSWDTTGA